MTLYTDIRCSFGGLIKLGSSQKWHQATTPVQRYYHCNDVMMTSSWTMWRHHKVGYFKALYLRNGESVWVETCYMVRPLCVIDKNWGDVIMTSSCDFMWIFRFFLTLIYISWTENGRIEILSTICLSGNDKFYYNSRYWCDVMMTSSNMQLSEKHTIQDPIVMKLGG